MSKLLLSLTLPAVALFAASSQMESECPGDCPPPRIDLEGTYQLQNANGVTISASALYWKPYEEGLDFVIKNKGATTVNNDGTVERARFDWNWGSRVDLGYEIPNKRMDLDLCWTWYKTHGSVSETVASPNALFSVWSIPNGSGTQWDYLGKADTHLQLNSLDLGISGTFAPRRFLEITPSINLSALWIHQKFNYNLSGGPGILGLTVIDDNIEMKNNFFGLGPKAGIDTLWNLGWGFGIVGNFNISILYGYFDISQSETVVFRGTAPNTYLDLSRNFYHNPRVNFDLTLGMRWDKMFCQGKYHLLLEAGWENLIFTGQNQLLRFHNTTYPANNSSVNGDLALQGLSLRALFAF
jgi:hypothetical protein